jgi:prephenate dehydrogenase
MKPLVGNLVVVGTGLIGASVAGALRERGGVSRVVGVGRNRSNLDAALERALVDAVSQDLDAALADADLVILAAPVDSCRALLAQVVAAAPAAATITDAGSVKAPLMATAEQLGIAARFVGAHPMAGGTETGAAHARADLFEGCMTVVTPGDAERRRVGLVSDLWGLVGAKVVEMSAEEHDAVVARTSHLPQMLSYALAASLADASSSSSNDLLYALAGNGLRDTTRLAASDASMWKAISAENKQELLSAMTALDGVWQDLRSAIADDDESALEGIIARAQAFRRGLDNA